MVRGGAADWKAVQEWNVASLKEILRRVSVNVAVTPKGYVVSDLLFGSQLQFGYWNLSTVIEMSWIANYLIAMQIVPSSHHPVNSSS